jgi:small multidrug resistance family-3 protein
MPCMPVPKKWTGAQHRLHYLSASWRISAIRTAPRLLALIMSLKQRPGYVENPSGNTGVMTILKSALLFALAAVAEIGGAWLIWQAVREDKAWWWAGLGIVALGFYGFVAAFQPDAHFGRVLAAYGGVFIVGSLAWGILLDGFRPDRWDLIGAAVCLVGVAVIMFAPRQG